MFRKCRVCGKNKDLDSFPKDRNDCKKCRRVYGIEYRRRNKKLLATKWATYRRLLKKRVLDHYSNGRAKCRCCGETILAFLTLDHVKGGGNRDRKKHGEGSTFFLSLVRRKFPVGFQVLCSNCQLGKQIRKGFCPHHPRTDLRKPR